MFQLTPGRLSRLLSLVDDVLGDPIEEAPQHPHRQPLRWAPIRRRGMIAPAPTSCRSPVRRRQVNRELDTVER